MEQNDDKEELPVIIVLSDNPVDELILAKVEPQCGAEKYLAGPSGNANTAWEIWVHNSPEFTKLPMAKFPVTTTSYGKVVTLTCSCHKKDHLQCEASFHRYSKGNFYIGSANRRLGGQSWTIQYRSFLDTHGLRSLGSTGQPKQVWLKFEAQCHTTTNTRMPPEG